MECEKSEESKCNEINDKECDRQALWGVDDDGLDDGKKCVVDYSEEKTEEEFNADDDSENRTVKIVVFGKDGTGKTALIVRLLTRRFIHEYDPTSEDVYAHHCVIEGEEVVLKIMDTAGMVERNIHEREEQIRWGDGFLLVLSLTNTESLKVLHLIRALIEEVGACDKPMVLLANKSDLLQAREVAPSAISELEEKWNCSAFETAATEDYSLVEEPFVFLCKQIMKKKRSQAVPVLKTKIDSELILADVHKRFEPRFQKDLDDTKPQSGNSSEISEVLVEM